MNRINKTVSAVLTFLVLTMCFTFVCFAQGESVNSVLGQNGGRVMSISHRGESSSFPKNSLEAAEEAVKNGADMVSVYVRKTSDNVLVLCESGSLDEICLTENKSVEALTSEEILKLRLYGAGFKESDCKVQTLLSFAERVKGRAIIVVDADEALIDDVSALAEANDLNDTLIFRTKMSSGKIKKWKEKTNSSLHVLGIYKGNVVFNAASHLKTLSKLGEPMVQYQNKNYFDVSFNNFTAKKYGKGENARAVCAMYDRDLCGQRDDCVSGWDEMVKRGFSVIETNDIKGLTAYINSLSDETSRLAELLNKAKEIDTSVLSQVSAKELSSAVVHAESCLSGTHSLGEVQSSYSELLQQINTLSHQSGKETKKGALNITVGKVAAVIVFGSLLLLGEIYLVKKRKSKTV